MNGIINDLNGATEPARGEVDAYTGPQLIEFGTGWCGYCQAAQPLISRALKQHIGTGVRHVKVEDGKGKPLGRSFRVKLWPTLIFMRDGQEVDRLVRPTDVAAITAALAKIDPPPG